MKPCYNNSCNFRKCYGHCQYEDPRHCDGFMPSSPLKGGADVPIGDGSIGWIGGAQAEPAQPIGTSRTIEDERSCPSIA